MELIYFLVTLHKNLIMELQQNTYKGKVDGVDANITHNIETGDLYINANVSVRLNYQNGEWKSQTPDVLPAFQDSLKLEAETEILNV